MKETYTIRIERPGMADIPDLARTAEIPVAAELVRCLLACRDDRVARVVVEIQRAVTMERAV